MKHFTLYLRFNIKFNIIHFHKSTYFLVLSEKNNFKKCMYLWDEQQQHMYLWTKKRCSHLVEFVSVLLDEGSSEDLTLGCSNSNELPSFRRAIVEAVVTLGAKIKKIIEIWMEKTRSFFNLQIFFLFGLRAHS